MSAAATPEAPPSKAEQRRLLEELIEGQRESVRIAEEGQGAVDWFAALEAAPISGLEATFAEAAMTAAQVLDPKSPAGKEAQEALALANRQLLVQSRARTRADEAAAAHRAVTVDLARARLAEYEAELEAL